jgi:hypothetical protein
MTEYDHFDSKLPSLCGILVSASSVVKLLWPMTPAAGCCRFSHDTFLRITSKATISRKKPTTATDIHPLTTTILAYCPAKLAGLRWMFSTVYFQP